MGVEGRERRESEDERARAVGGDRAAAQKEREHAHKSIDA
jgi:hypothetical protein